MQLDESTGPSRKGPWEVIKNIYMNEGGLRRGLFKGWCVTLAREIPGLGTYFATYEALTTKSKLNQSIYLYHKLRFHVVVFFLHMFCKIT